MATEPGDPDIDRWLDGLAGRPGEGAAHAEGQRLRQALQPEGQAQKPRLSWAQLEQRAAAETLAPPPSPAPEAPSPVLAPRPAAANDGWWRPWHGWAAAVLVTACVALVMQQSEPEPQLRGSGGTVATWVVDDPQAAADRLATELRGLGAQVQARPVEGQVELTLQASGTAAEAVNRRLAPLETALDAAGTLTLRVRQR